MRIAALFLLTVFAGPAWAAESLHQQGTIQICKYEFGNNQCEKKKIELGEEVHYTLSVYEDDFFGNTIINANGNIANRSDRKVKGVYHIAFFDGEGKLVGAHSGSWDLEPGKDINYGSALLYVEADRIEDIVSYQIATYTLPPKK